MVGYDELIALGRKLAVAHQDDLPQFWMDFYDLAERPGFDDLGAVWDDPEVQGLVLSAAEGTIGKPLESVEGEMVRIPEANFVHGRYVMNGLPVMMVYFPAVTVGCVMVVPGGETIRYGRFFVTPKDLIQNRPM